MEGRTSLKQFQRSMKKCAEKQETEDLGVALRKKHEAFGNSKLINR